MSGEFIPVQATESNAQAPLDSSHTTLFSSATDGFWKKKTYAGGITCLHEFGAPNAQLGTTYTLVATDGYTDVTMSNAAANTVTIPTNASVPFPVGIEIEVGQIGAGLSSIAGATGVTVNTAPSYATRGQWSRIKLKQIAANVWVVSSIN